MKLPTHTKISYHHLTTKEQRALKKGFKIQVKDHFEVVRDSLEIGTIDVNKGDRRPTPDNHCYQHLSGLSISKTLYPGSLVKG